MVKDEHDDKPRDKAKKPIKLEELLAYHEMEVPLSFRDPSTYKRFSLYQFIYSLSGLVLGLVCILGGIVLFLNGIVGSTSWTTRILGVESNVSDAAPGAVLFIVGLFVVLVTRFRIKVK